jgi:hypothetical protein
MRGIGVAALVAVMLGVAAPAQASDGGFDVRVGADEITIGNGLVERTWTRAPFVTKAIVDKRGEDRTWSAGSRDFALVVGTSELGSDQLTVQSARVVRRKNLRRIVMTLTGIPGLEVIRTAEVRKGIAGIRMSTALRATAAMPLSAVVLEEAGVAGAAPALTALRAGSDWREPGYAGPDLALGDKHPGTWRDTRTAPAGGSVAGPGQWLSLAKGGRTMFLVAEGTDFPSARGAYDGTTAQLRNDYGKDVVLLGPIEESGHIENPQDTPGRARLARPGRTLQLESVFVGFGEHPGDDAWQWAKEVRARARYTHDVIFNSDRVDDDRSGAKDSMDIRRVRETAPIAKALGVETFVLDDGWQAISGDWCPDSPQCPEPSGTPPKFPDDHFAAVREEIAPMKLGLWMSPLHFNPDSKTFAAHPEYGCEPYTAGLDAYNHYEPESGSNEAGVAPWGPNYIPFLEGRIAKAITEWDVRYFKFDFIAWLDCADQGDIHDFRDGFVAMLDRLRSAHPDVTFSIDETNDYRLFPFLSTLRGPTWFQNGNPPAKQLLHNLWNLSPYVPAAAIGQHIAVSGTEPLSTRMAAALLSHTTFFTDIRTIPAGTVPQIREWTDFYRANRTLFTRGAVHPLLADPLAGGWTALQSWDPEKGRGALLAFRQGAAEATQRIALTNIPEGKTYEVRRGPAGTLVGTFTSQQLTEGLDVTLPEQGADVLTILAK